MNIFTITMAPINPPHDDGAKNIMIGVAKRLKDDRFFFVSSLTGQKFAGYYNVTFIQSPFQRKGRHSMSLLQKLYVLMATVFLKNKIDLFQFFVTPQPYFSKFYKKFLMTNKRASIQITTSIHTLFDRNRKESISSLFFADHVVVNSDHAKRMLEDAGVKNVIRIYPGVETERFKPLVAKNTCCGRKVVYPGTYKILNDSYSFEDFLDIAVHVTKYVPDVNFVMACRVRTREDALLKKKFISLLKARDISNFTITDTVEDMPALFNDCVAGIMPAKKPMVGILEIPLVILELAALGKPVVYGNVAPLDEISTKGIGILAADNTVGSYAESLKKCICDVAFSSQVGARSRDAVSRDFTMDNVASQYRQLYRSMTENKTA